MVRPKTLIGGAVAIAVLAVVVVVLRSVPDVVTIVRGFRVAEQRVRAADAQWTERGIAGLAASRELLADAAVSLARARETAESTPFLRYLPITRSFLRTASATADAGGAYIASARALAEIAADGTRLMDRYASRSLATLTSADIGDIAEFLGSAVARGRTASDALAVGGQLAAHTRCPVVARALSRLVPFCPSSARIRDAPSIRRLQSVRDDLTAALAAVDAVAALSVSGEPHDVLFLFLNNTEIRPGGGFLGTYGVATFRNGALERFHTDDVYNLDRFVEGAQRVDPPAPFRDHGIVQYWYLRDANWSPDFAESSRTVLDFFVREGGGRRPEIVIGVTPTLAAAILGVVGPVEIHGKRFNAENITDELEYQVEKGYYEQGIPRPQRKAIIEPLTRTVVDRILHRPIRELAPLVSVLRTAIRERHLMAYADDPAIERAIARVDAAGTLSPLPATADALMVVDANLGALKSDPVVERSIRYAIIPDGDGFRGVVRLRYRNTGTFTWKTTRYRTYTRVLLPPGTTFIGATGAMLRDRSEEPGRVDIGAELGRTVFGAFVSIEPGQERTIAFEFHLAPEISARIQKGSYGLQVQKQLGSSAVPLTLDLEFGTPVRAATPPEPPAAWGDGRYGVETDLREDREFIVNF